MDNTDKLLIGGIVVAGIVLWPQIKKTVGGISDAAGGVSDVVGSTGAIIGQTGANVASGIDFYKDNLFPPTALPNMLNKPAPATLFNQGYYPNNLSGVATFFKSSANYVSSGNLPNTSTPKGAVYTPPPVSLVASVNAPNTSTVNGAVYSPPPTFGVLSPTSSTLNRSSITSKNSGSKTTTSLNKNQILARRAGGGYRVIGAKNIKLNK